MLTQSLAIIEYLDEIHPEPPLLAGRRARTRQSARASRKWSPATFIRSTISSPLQYLKRQLKHEQPEIDAWYHHWVIEGFNAIEAMIAPGPYACGAQVTLADICLVPQVFNARRLKVPLDTFPENRRGRRRLSEAAGLRQGAARKPAGCGVTAGRTAC